MNIAIEFFNKLKNSSDDEPIVAFFFKKHLHHSNELTFENILNAYAKYFSELSDTDQEKFSGIFWEQVKFFGTPIIEADSQDNNKCYVYFLFPKNKLSISLEAPKTKKDLYLQGDFHGYGSTDGRQKLLELEDTGIMWRKDSMPKDALVVYKYIEVEPSYRGKKPEPELPPFFANDKEFTASNTNTAKFPNIPQSVCTDEYSTHISPFPGFNWGELVFRVSIESEPAHVSGEFIDWPSLLNTDKSNFAKHFVYHGTFYSDQAGALHRSNEKVSKQYHDDLHHLPYANFTRNIQVFKPVSDKIDDIIVINDGIPYLIVGAMDHFEKMVNEKKLSPHTAFVFIGTLPGLESTLTGREANDFYNDSSANISGMGERLIDYKYGIDAYIDFIANKLFPLLKNEISIPACSSHRIMIGSSLSGTASIYIGSYPNLFGGVIAQSPSPNNREVLSRRPREMLVGGNIYLSCGYFEDPAYAAANANIEYARELSRKLNIPLHTGAHGHQFVAWNEELERSLPLVQKACHSLSAHNHKKANKHSFRNAHSIYSQVKNLSHKTEKNDETLKVHRKKGG